MASLFCLPVLAVTPMTEITRFAEMALQEVALFLKIVLEFTAILTVAIALLFSFKKILRRTRLSQQSMRLDLGHSLALALEFLLAADVVGTAVSPSWDAIAKLAAITGIRTILNYFLQREVRELQQSSQHPPLLNP
jgi:uncharacterized membrane protein